MPAFYVARAGTNAGITTNGQTGIIAPSAQGWNQTSGGTTLNANRAYFSRFVPRRNMTITVISFVTGTAATNNDACDVGIYSSDLATKLVSAGATSAKLNATAGLQTITVTSTALAAGAVYYAAFSCGAVGGTAAKLVMADFNANANGMTFFGTTTGTRETFVRDTSHPLPSDASSSLIATSSQSAILGIRES